MTRRRRRFSTSDRNSPRSTRSRPRAQAADEFPRSIKLGGELRARSNGCASKSAPIRPGETGCAQRWRPRPSGHAALGDTTSSAAGKSGEVTALPLIYADQQRTGLQHVFAGLRAEAQAARSPQARSRERPRLRPTDRWRCFRARASQRTRRHLRRRGSAKAKWWTKAGAVGRVSAGRMPAILRLLADQPFSLSSENVAKTYGAQVEPVYLSMKNQ